MAFYGLSLTESLVHDKAKDLPYGVLSPWLIYGLSFYYISTPSH